MDSRPRIEIVGLGPGDATYATADTLELIARVEPRFVRTVQHPSANLVHNAVAFDDVYESSDRFDDVYVEIAERLVAAATEHGVVLYAVPGSPLVLERTVRNLIDDDRVDAIVHPAMSFLDLAWARLGVDPIESAVRLVDGHEFTTAAADASGAVLVAHTHANWVLSNIKLSIDDPSIDNTPVVLLHRLGTADEELVATTWAEMDHVIDADHLTSLYIPELPASPGSGYVRFHQLARTLRERCPWDTEQTHQSLVPYLIEEAYEVVDAIAGLDPNDPTTDEALIEELGDLLYQIEFHATIAEQDGRFTIADITTGIYDKLVRRHPHVFPDAAGVTVDAEGTEQVLTNWEAIKRAEKGRTSIFQGIPESLPALAYANKVQGKAARVGFDWPDIEGPYAKIDEEVAELRDASVRAAAGDLPPDQAEAEIADELGDLLFTVVNVARHLGVEPESALRAAIHKFRRRFEQVEQIALDQGLDLADADLASLDVLWEQAKSDYG